MSLRNTCSGPGPVPAYNGKISNINLKIRKLFSKLKYCTTKIDTDRSKKIVIRAYILYI